VLTAAGGVTLNNPSATTTTNPSTAPPSPLPMTTAAMNPTPASASPSTSVASTPAAGDGDVPAAYGFLLPRIEAVSRDRPAGVPGSPRGPSGHRPAKHQARRGDRARPQSRGRQHPAAGRGRDRPEHHPRGLEKAAGTVAASCTNGSEQAISHLTGLIPGGSYSTFVVHLDVQGAGRFTPWGDAQGTTNNFTADTTGTASPTNTVPGCLTPNKRP